jgi:hypothetical protein
MMDFSGRCALKREFRQKQLAEGRRADACAVAERRAGGASLVAWAIAAFPTIRSDRISGRRK